jgi:hypothetical protein
MGSIAARTSSGVSFVDLDVRLPVADDAAVGRTQGGERKTVRGGASGDPQHGNLALEQRTERLVEVARQGIVVVRRVGLVRGAHRLPHAGVDGGGIVGKELAHRNAPSFAGVERKKETPHGD